MNINDFVKISYSNVKRVYSNDLVKTFFSRKVFSPKYMTVGALAGMTLAAYNNPEIFEYTRELFESQGINMPNFKMHSFMQANMQTLKEFWPKVYYEFALGAPGGQLVYGLKTIGHALLKGL